MVETKRIAKKTAKLHDLDTVESSVETGAEEVDRVEDKEVSKSENVEQTASAIAEDPVNTKKAAEPSSNFNSPKVVPAVVTRDDRNYAGPATKLMNEIYDAAGVPAMEVLPGWDRITHIIAKACERLEKSGWRRGK